jgi:adenylate cyclase class IV
MQKSTRRHSTIEIKYRGPLSKAQSQRLFTYLQKHGSFIKTEHEKAFYFESTAFPSIGDFKWGIARMSFKVTGRYIILRLKDGNAAANKREEFEVRILRSQLSNLCYIFYRLGMKDVFFRPALRHEYQYGQLTIIVKQKCIMGDHFEAQLKDESKAVKEALHQFIRELRLRCWTSTEYKDRITTLMKKAPAISILQVPNIQ